MQPSAEAQLEAIAATVTGLEQLCNELEFALRETDWPRMDAAIADTRRTMHALENAMADATPVRTVEFDKAIFARLQRVYSVRDEQMKRLTAVHEEIAERLRALSRWKGYARSIGSEPTRPPRIFSDLR